MENLILNQLGLDTNQILIYEYLLETGPSKASTIAKNTPLKRGLVYKTLDELVELQIIQKDDPEGAVSIFTPLHPSALKSLAESKVRIAQNAQNHLDSEIGSLVSMYNLANNKPGIEFYEGIEGVKKVINDVLTATEIIYTVIDIEELNKNSIMKKLNTEHTKKRESLDINKKILVPNTSFSRNELKNYHSDVTTIRIMPKNIQLESGMQLYNNKISYTTIKKDAYIGMIISDKSTYSMHRNLFEILWNISTPIN